MTNTTLTLDILDTDDEFATDADMSFFEAEEPTDSDIAEIAAEKPVKAKKARKPKAPATPKVKAKKVVEEETIEEEKPERSGAFIGLNNFDRARAEGKSSAKAMWRGLLTDGTVEILFASEHAVIGGSAIVEAAEQALADAKASKDAEAIKVAQKAYNRLYTKMSNRITQRVQQPYQTWYPKEKAKGVFVTSINPFKNGNPKSLEVGFDDEDRPPVLVKANGKPNVIGKLVLSMLDDGITDFECGVTTDMLDELRESVAETGE